MELCVYIYIYTHTQGENQVKGVVNCENKRNKS